MINENQRQMTLALAGDLTLSSEYGNSIKTNIWRKHIQKHEMINIKPNIQQQKKKLRFMLHRNNKKIEMRN